MTISGRGDWIELAKRAADGMEIALLWDRSRGQVKVAVSDERVCHYLDLDVARADVLRAFNGPFANATERLVASGSGYR